MSNDPSRSPSKAQSISKTPSPVLSKLQRNEIAKRLYVLAKATRAETDAGLIDIYLQAIQDLPFPALAQALERMISERATFPKIPDIRDACGMGPESEKKRIELEADTEWEKVAAAREEISEMDFGYSELLDAHLAKRAELAVSKFSETSRYALRQIGWWRGLTSARPENMHFVRADFTRYYVRYASTDGLKLLPSGFSEFPPRVTEGLRKLLAEKSIGRNDD